MTFSLNQSQIEVNCRRLYSFKPNSLDRDEHGTLHYRPKWYQRIYRVEDESASGIADGIPASRIRNPSIKPVILSTLRGMRTEMHATFPICTFIVPGIDGNIHSSHKHLALRVKVLFPTDLEIQSEADEVIRDYDSIDYKLKLPHGLNKFEVRQINDFVKSKMLHSFDGRVDLTRKETHAEFTILDIQKQIRINKIWDDHAGRIRDLHWVITGAWRNQS